jgi:hypothetical protein
MAVNDVASDESEMESDECAEREVGEDEDVEFDAAPADASTSTASSTGTAAGAFSGACITATAAATLATSSSSMTSALASIASASGKTAQKSNRFGFIPEPVDAPPLNLPANTAAARPAAAQPPPPAFGGASAARFKASLETDAADAARLRRRARLMRRMIQRFLSGADAQWTDYGAIDRDASLDEDAAHDDGRGSGDDDDEDASGGGARAASASSANAWARDSATRDAEDRYFDDM